MIRLRAIFPAVFAASLFIGCGGETEEDSRDMSLPEVEPIAMMGDTAQTEEDTPEEPQATPPRTNTRPATTRPAPRPQQPAPEPDPPTLGSGTMLVAQAGDTITSRHNSVGDTVRAIIGESVSDENGQVVIPAGSVLWGTVSELAEAETPGGEGRMAFAFHEVEIDGNRYAIRGVSDSLETWMKGRGVTAGDAAKVGAGAVVGAVAGRVIGGNRTGTAVGAVAGAAAGVGIAAATRDVDILLNAGSAVIVSLSLPFVKP
ncbi:MAG: hypothetical protein OEZ54_00165 [Gemmatimonadota bacterium]|nr:hypothetical protein [Gemmatimonadota bacterium]